MNQLKAFKTVCQLDDAGIFTNLTQADLCPIEKNVYLLPFGCIESEPPAAKDDHAAKWTGEAWEYIKDARGQTFYKTTDGSEFIVADLGPLPDDVTEVPRPDSYHQWNKNAQKWETNEQVQVQKQIDWRNIAPEITPKQLRLILLENGITSTQVDAAINTIADEQTKQVAMIEWQYATGYQRNNPNLILIATQLLGLNDQQIDAMWIAALEK